MAVAVSVIVPGGEDVDQYQPLREFRWRVYGSLTGWADTLFEACDALVCGTGRLESLPHLSLEPQCRRGHGSVYAALDRGVIDTDALGEALAGALCPEWGWVFAADTSGWPRPKARTSPQRTHNYDVRKDGGDHRWCTTPGWSFGWLAQVGPGEASWVAPVDVDRVGPDRTPAGVTVSQIRRLVARLARSQPGVIPIVCHDAGYAVNAVATPLAGEQVQVVIRLKSHAVFHTCPPPPAPGTRGRPRRHGQRIKLSDPSTWPDPDQHLLVPPGTKHAALSISAWHRVHPKPSKDLHEPGNDRSRNTNRQLVHGTLIQIRSADPSAPTMWLWWSGPAGSFELDQIWRAYLRRFGIEHFFRFIKQYLAWTTPRLRPPAQAERWSWIVATAYTHLVLARTLTTSHHPWHRHGPLSPLRVKRGFRNVHPHLGTPAKPPQKSKPGPGRPKGRPNQRKHPDHPVVKKSKR